ncbi:MAG: hypothetical protein ACI351_07875 [Candidatus Avelusimicrobium sp.]|uniref:hypothetical protein n=1 Tax=Candidatus Avelusimicrobium sp. TaxID=3048833 RepID=UPI003F019474
MTLSESLIGQNMNAHPDCLGIYIGIDEIYVAQSAKKDGGTVLESLVRVPINAVDRTTLKPLDLNETFFSMDNWLDALGKVTSKKKWKTNRVVISLAPAFCLLRHFVIPAAIERKMWKSSIPLQARKYIHFPFEKAEYAYHVYEFETAATKQKRLGVVFALTTKLIIERLQKGLKTVGLELVSVESSSLSLGRAFNDSDKEAVGDGGRIYSFFGKDMANFVFLNENAPVLLREVEISGSLPAERRRFEITNCTEFIAKQLEKDPFEEAVIVGTDIEQWVPALEADSKKPVRKWNLSEIYGIETKSAGEISAIGASIKFYDHKTPDIDFTKGNRLSEYEFSASLTAWKVAAVLMILIVLLIGKGYLNVQNKDKELQRTKASQQRTVADFNGLTANQIQTNLSRMKTQNNNLQAMTRYDNTITPLIMEIVDTIPQQIWITKLEYADPFPNNGSESRSVKIEGSIASGKDGQTDLVIGNKFRDALAEQPIVSKICGKDANINFVSVAGTSSAGGNKMSGGKNADNETRFVFSCSKAGGRNNGR